MAEPAPEITLTAVASKRRIALNAVTTPTLLMLFDQGTSAQIDPVLSAVREVWPTADLVQIANVVDLRKFPKIVRKVAETLLNNSYKNNAKNVKEGRDPADYVIILPDWQAKVMKAVGIDDVSTRIAIAVVAPGGRLIGAYQGDGEGEKAVEMLREAVGEGLAPE